MDIVSNRYAAPQSRLEMSVPDEEFPVASRGRRFCTLLVDYVVFYVFCFLLGVAVVLAFGKAGAGFLHNGLGTGAPLWSRYVSGTLILVVYYLVLEGLWGRTVGKIVCGTRVVSTNRQEPTFGQVVKRTFARLIPFEAFSFFGKRGWHDSLSDTVVVQVRGTRR